MKRTRHQFAPAMPGQKVIDRAVAGSVPDGLLIGRLEIVDVQHLSGPGGLGEARQQGLLLGHRHVLALASAARLGLERLDPAVVIGHVRPVHRAQRDTHGRCNRRLRHPALAQQYHLDALTLHGGNFPAQRRLQLPDLGLAAFDHLFPLRIRWSERITPCSSKTIPFSRIRNQRKNPRFNQLWKRYKFQGPIIPVIYNIDFRNPASYFLATTFEMRNKDVIYVSNSVSVEATKFLTYVRLLNATINDPISSAINAYTLKNIIQTGVANTAIITGAQTPIINVPAP